MSERLPGPLKGILSTVIVVAPLATLVLLFPPDGRERANWIQLIG